MLAIECGSSFSEALAQYPKVFDRLFINMIKAGELAGALEMSLRRLADFMEKAARIRGKVKAALFYPAAVLTVATGVMALMLVFVVPRFKEVFADLGGGRPLPAFTRFVLGISRNRQRQPLFFNGDCFCAMLYVLFLVAIQTETRTPCFRSFQVADAGAGAGFPQTRHRALHPHALGTLITSGVPILQALAIVKDATGNVIIGKFVGRVRENVEQGESIVGPLRESNIFPAMVVGMVDVGEQTGSLPEMLNKIADTYDEEVDNAVAAMTSLLEPIMICFPWSSRRQHRHRHVFANRDGGHGQ